MKRIIIYTIALLLAVSACKVDYDYKFDDISTYRLSQYIEECDDMLIKEENGWKFVYYPEEETYGGYTFLMKFSKVDENDEHGTRVLIESDLYIEPTGMIQPVPDQTISSYNYVVSLGPVLSFDTYSLLHFLSDPSSTVYGGKSGVGYNGEFEFLITDVDVANKKLSLLGKQYKREAVMVPATEDDWNNLSRQRQIMKNFKNDPTLFLYQYLVVGTDTALINYSSALRMAYLTYVKDGKTVAESYPVYSTTTGVKFKKPAKLGDLEFDEISFNTNSKLIQINNPEAAGRYKIFRASSQTENCLLRFPGAIDIARTYADGFSMVENGVDLTNNGGADKMNLFPSGYSIQEFRYYWNLVGKIGAEIYVHPDGSAAGTYAKLYGYELGADQIGDKIHFIYINQSYYTGTVTDEINRWFGFTYAAPPLTGDAEGPGGGSMHKYVTNIRKIDGENVNRGHIVIPVGKQFYMVQSGNNLAWALYTPLQVSRF